MGNTKLEDRSKDKIEHAFSIINHISLGIRGISLTLLDHYDEKGNYDSTQGTAAIPFSRIPEILHIVRAEDLKDLIGGYVYTKHGPWQIICAIGSVYQDEWMDLDPDDSRYLRKARIGENK
jgi:hypothetical protein